MEPIILVGGGGHCISCIDVVEQTGLYQIVGILDLPERKGEKVLNYSIIGTDENIEGYVDECPNFLITVGQIKNSDIREKIFQKVVCAGGKLPVVISPFAYVSAYAKIGKGSIIMHHALVNANVSMGICSIINTKALLEHDVSIGDFCHISTASVINGQVNIGNHCFIGSNSVVANNIDIVANAIIGAGSKVLKNINLPGTYVGQTLKKIS